MCPCGQTGGTRQVSEESGVAIPAPPVRGTETLTQQAEPGGPFTRAGPTVSDTPAEAPWDTKLSHAHRALSRLLPRETVSTMTRGGSFTARFWGGSLHSTAHRNTPSVWNVHFRFLFCLLFLGCFAPSKVISQSTKRSPSAMVSYLLLCKNPPPDLVVGNNE